MGLKDLFSRKEEKRVQNEVKSNVQENTQGLVLGVLDTFQLLNTDDLVVIGKVKGTIHVGDAVYLSNVGEDGGKILLTTIKGIETGPGVAVKEASDCQVGLRLEKGKLHNIKKGTVLYSREASSAAVHNAYISALGDTYVMRQNLELSDKDIEELSITDCAEIWRLFSWFHSKSAQTESEEAKQEYRQKLDKLCAAICKKILEADAIYCVYSNDTGEPYLLSRTIRQDDGSYMCTPPDIMIFTDAYKTVLSAQFSEDRFEIKKIENGESKDGIYNFLGSTFYLNGACGVRVLSEQTAIGADMLVPPPDYSDVKPQDIPVTNPDLVRWMLLLGQLEKPDGKDAEIIYNLYYRFMSKEMVKARFLVPMQSEGEISKGDESGEIALKKDTSIKFPTMEGKYDKPAVYMYTDWKRLRMVYGTEWGGLVQPIEGMIEVFDCAINVTEYVKAGGYISTDMFEEMKKL